MAERNFQEDEIRRIVRDETRGAGEPAPETPAADPVPLGLAGFALTLFVLSWVNAGYISASALGVFVPLAFFYGGLALVLAGMWAFRINSTFGAVAFISYGAFWLAIGFFVFFNERLGITEETLAQALGITLVAWTIFTFYMLVATLKTNMALFILFVLLFVTLVLLDIANLAGLAGFGVAGGYVGIVTALVAWYISAAGIINPIFGRTVLPVGSAPM